MFSISLLRFKRSYRNSDYLKFSSLCELTLARERFMHQKLKCSLGSSTFRRRLDSVTQNHNLIPPNIKPNNNKQSMSLPEIESTITSSIKAEAPPWHPLYPEPPTIFFKPSIYADPHSQKSSIQPNRRTHPPKSPQRPPSTPQLHHLRCPRLSNPIGTPTLSACRGFTIS